MTGSSAPMRDVLATLRDGLAPVRRRQRLAGLLSRGGAGLAVGAGVAVALGLVTWYRDGTASIGAVSGAISVGLLLGLIAGALRRSTWDGAARAIDSAGGLKDGTASALAFAGAGRVDGLHGLQIDLASRAVTEIEPRAVVALRPGRATSFAAGLLLAALGVMFLPTDRVGSGAPPRTTAAAATTAAEIEAEVAALARRLEHDADPSVRELLRELKEMAREIGTGEPDLRRSLARLSDMQEAIARLVQGRAAGEVERRLAELGRGLQAVDVLAPAGRLLDQGELARAAKALEKLADQDDLAVDKNQARTMEEALRELEADLGEAEMQALKDEVRELREAASELADASAAPPEPGTGEAQAGGAESGTRSSAQDAPGADGKQKTASRARLERAAGELAERVRRTERAEEVADQLRAQTAALERAKSELVRASQPASEMAESPTPGGTPGTRPGQGSPESPYGEKTELDGARKRQGITGRIGEGPPADDPESVASRADQGQARRAFRDRYQDYKKQSDAVLESEPIPLGQREIIRRYFELIRPREDGED